MRTHLIDSRTDNVGVAAEIMEGAKVVGLHLLTFKNLSFAIHVWKIHIVRTAGGGGGQ